DVLDTNGKTIKGAGAAYLFDGTSGQLLVPFQSPSPAAGDEFGFAVVAFGSDVLIAAPLEEPGADFVDVGAVYEFNATTGNLIRRIDNPSQSSRYQFGFGLATGASGLLVGAPGGRAAYLFTPCASGCSPSVQAPLAQLSLRATSAGRIPPACVSGYCDDGDPCTVDRSQPGVGCTHTRNPSCPARGCSANSQCQDTNDCNGVEECDPCDGCFLHRWACCQYSAMCIAGLRPADGVACDSGSGTCMDASCEPL